MTPSCRLSHFVTEWYLTLIAQTDLRRSNLLLNMNNLDIACQYSLSIFSSCLMSQGLFSFGQSQVFSGERHRPNRFGQSFFKNLESIVFLQPAHRNIVNDQGMGVIVDQKMKKSLSLAKRYTRHCLKKMFDSVRPQISKSVIGQEKSGCDQIRQRAFLPIHRQAVWNKLFQTVSFAFSDQGYCILPPPWIFE